jgi:O-antigen/teichoic acid export membrane protein
VKVDVIKNGLYNVISSVIRGGIGIITIPLLIRSLGVEEYGLWTLAYALVGTVALMEGGLSTATTVFVSQDLSKEDNNELLQTLTIVLISTLFLSSVAAIVLLCKLEVW